MTRSHAPAWEREKVMELGGAYHLRETQAAYMSNFMPENSVLRAKNTYVWEVNP